MPSFLHYLLCLAHLFILLGPVHAFTPTWTANAKQCGEFIVQWTVTSSSGPAGPPFNLLIVPVNQPYTQFPNSAGLTGANLSAPIQVAIPDGSWNAASNTGSYTISALPLRSGERFIVVMDDGFGFGTGGVSDIQTVTFDDGPTNCLGPLGSNSGILFDLGTFAPSQCQPLSITSAQASAIRGFVPGGSPFSLDLPAASTGNMTTTWDVNVRTGSSFVLVYIGKDGKLASSGLSETTGGNTDHGTACLTNSPHTTLGLSGTATNLLPGSSASVGSSSGGGGSGPSISIPALIGGIIGALAFLAITALVIFFCIVRRTDAMGRPKSRSATSHEGGRSTVEPYKSYDLTSGSGLGDEAAATGVGGGGGAKRARAGSAGRKISGGARGSSSPSSAAGPSADSGTLEARFGGGLFGRKKKGTNGGRGGANGSNRDGNDLTNSQRRAMYPGLSIASTQNRSVGAVSAGTGLAGEDGYLDESRGRVGGTRNEPNSPPVGGIVTAYREAKRREARAEREHVRRESDPSSFVSGNGTTSSAPITEENQRPAGRRRGDLSAIEEGTGYDSGTHMTQLADQRRRRHSFEDSDTYRDGSSTAMLLANMSTNEKVTSSNPTSGSDLALGASAAAMNSGRRPSTAPNSGTAPYHLPTSLVRSPGGNTVNTGDSALRMHEYPPDTKDDSEPIEMNWRVGSGSLAAGYHPYAMAKSPHSDSYSSPAHSGSATTPTAGSVSSRGRGGTGRGAGARHPYADPLNLPTEIIRHTDAGPMMGDSEDEDDEAGVGGMRRVVELPPSYGEVTSSNRGRRTGGGGG